MTRRLNPQLLFVALAVAINVVALSMARGAAGPNARAVAVGAVLDITVTVPILYYFLVVRPQQRSLFSLAFITLLALWRAAFAFPQIVPGKLWIGASLECFAIAALIVGLRRALSAAPDSDPAARIHAAARGILPFSAAASALAGELTVLYYGLAWRAKPHVEEGSQTFTLHRRSGFSDILFFVGLASLLEILPIHLILARWSTPSAWVATGLSLYGAFWAVAMSRAFALRPTLVSKREVLLRFGLLAQIRIPMASIRNITSEIPPNCTVFPRRTTPDVYLEFSAPLPLEKLMGIRTFVSGIAVSADDGTRFVETLVSAIPAVSRRIPQ